VSQVNQSCPESRGWLIWSVWVFGNACAGLVGGNVLDNWGTIGLVALATLLGTFQWMVLRLYHRVSVAWIPSTILGSLVGLGGGLLVGIVTGMLGFLGFELAGLDFINNNYKGSPIPVVICVFVLGGGSAGLTMGFILGMCQVSLLKVNQNAERAWLVASAGGVALASMVAGVDLGAREFQHLVTELQPRSYISSSQLFPSGLLSGLTFALLYGAITGIGLVRSLRLVGADNDYVSEQVRP
jgi:hypothetical protein